MLIGISINKILYKHDVLLITDIFNYRHEWLLIRISINNDTGTVLIQLTADCNIIVI